MSESSATLSKSASTSKSVSLKLIWDIGLSYLFEQAFKWYILALPLGRRIHQATGHQKPLLIKSRVVFLEQHQECFSGLNRARIRMRRDNQIIGPSWRFIGPMAIPNTLDNFRRANENLFSHHCSILQLLV